MRTIKRLAKAVLRVLYPALATAAVGILRLGARLGRQPWEHFERLGLLPIPLHFYQPYPPRDDLDRSGFFSARRELPGVDLALDASADRLTELGRRFGAECAWIQSSDDPHVYHESNDTFGFTSAAVAHAIVRAHRPQLIVEVGSGYSTHVLAGALARNRDEGGPDGRIVSIEPYPAEILNTTIPSLEERMERRVEAVDAALFDRLGAGDILFIDSSHIIRYGGDVLFLYNEILPRLRPGVLVHVHDIHLPEPYPEVYFREHRWVWNEQYLLQAFLCHNLSYEVLLPCWLLHRERDAVFAAAFPHYDPARHRPSSSFWLQRCPAVAGGGC